jgi:hypothetical protein
VFHGLLNGVQKANDKEADPRYIPFFPNRFNNAVQDASITDSGAADRVKAAFRELRDRGNMG